MVGALGAPVYDRAMRRGTKQEIASKPAQRTSGRDGAGAQAAKAAAVPPRRRRVTKIRKAAASVLEETVGYRFKDQELLDRSLTHISSVSGGNRGN